MSVSHTHTIERCLIYFVLLSDSVISEEFVKVKVNFIVNFFVCSYKGIKSLFPTVPW